MSLNKEKYGKVSSGTVYPVFFASHKICENRGGGGCVTFFNCVSHFLRLKKCLIANNTGYLFCV